MQNVIRSAIASILLVVVVASVGTGAALATQSVAYGVIFAVGTLALVKYDDHRIRRARQGA